MAVLYFDASAFVKLVVAESGSETAASLWDGADAIVSSRLAYPEVRAALRAARRNARLTASSLAQAERAWEDFWAEVRPVELTGSVQDHAGSIAAKHGLRGADAVHLASAQALGDQHVIVAVWDLRMHAAVRVAGLAVAPASLS